MGRVKKCPDLKTRWDPTSGVCILCKIRAGFQVTDHCGHDDHGSSHGPPYIQCKPNTFNDGSSPDCKPCSMCASGHVTLTQCNATTDTVCSDMRSWTTTVPVTTPPVTTQYVPAPSTNASTAKDMEKSFPTKEGTTPTIPHVAWAAPLAILIFIMLAASLAFILNMKRKRGQRTVIGFNRRPSYVNPGFSPLPTPACDNDLEDILNHNILSAPLQTVLDNLDVLEELVILLDPESQGIKNTKHLASLCSFPSPWVTYTYSMRESKSPLKALLEAVTSKNPEWTVGHLAKLLRHMERNDAITALAKLR
ncbi:IGF-like family receptor 1 isoform X2 [Acanthochromis polyacanthus]|uniref:IGF-like family receptor 1 isoform X2 n=1 Tax=Acanthochromis polyacanthus TaxID=80966 RepID=UPI000B90827F|nr:IGF-like family receptor 1 isoform X2 [Acanthochromis polyacanthus]